MRSSNILRRLDTGQSRFELCHQAFKAIRKLHNPAVRIQDTTNDALQRLAGAERQPPANGNEAAPEVALEVVQEAVLESPAGMLIPEPTG